MQRGMFIVIEGVDGAGSTTQTNLLATYLREQGRTVIATKEPTNGEIGKVIRENLSSKVPHAAIDALLFAADRAEHSETIIKPALQRGEDVVCDRYLESSLAYQTADGLELEWVQRLNRFAANPDYVIILDIDPATSLRRMHRSVHERFETAEFLTKVRKNFKARAASEGYSLVDAEKSILQVHEAIRNIILPKLEDAR